MTDLNKINGINNIKNIQNIQQHSKAEETKQPEKELSDRGIDSLRGQAAIVGRSQVQKTDNVKEDVNFMLRNPEIMAKSERFFEMAYERLLKEDSPNAYEKAAAMATTFARELATK